MQKNIHTKLAITVILIKKNIYLKKNKNKIAITFEY